MSGLEPIAYADGDTALTGWLAAPAGKPRGAMLIMPTIANRNGHMDRRAAMLAEAGFLTLIADFYGGPVIDFAHAGELANALRATPAHYRARVSSALACLDGLAPYLPKGAVGYCMGGQAALELARAGAGLALAASFHGLLDTMAPTQPGEIKARLLICHGDADPMVPRDAVLRFWEEMDHARADWHFHVYSGVKHGFTDPESDARGLPAIAYNASADRQSWAALMTLCDEVFGPI